MSTRSRCSIPVILSSRPTAPTSRCSLVVNYQGAGQGTLSSTDFAHVLPSFKLFLDPIFSSDFHDEWMDDEILGRNNV